MNFASWDANQPDTPGDRCIEMNGDARHMWDDADCAAQRRAMCQRGIPACGDPGEPLHGSRTPADLSTLLEGTVVEFFCNPGYVLEGANATKCLPLGSWDAATPTCRAVTCDASTPAVPAATATILSNAYRGVALYVCREGDFPSSDPVSVCQHNGNWSTPNFTCSAIPTAHSTTNSPLSATTGTQQNTTANNRLEQNDTSPDTRAGCACLPVNPSTNPTGQEKTSPTKQQPSFSDVMIPLSSVLSISVIVVLAIILCVVVQRKRKKVEPHPRIASPTYAYVDHYSHVTFKNSSSSGTGSNGQHAVRMENLERLANDRAAGFNNASLGPNIIVSNYPLNDFNVENSRGRTNTIHSIDDNRGRTGTMLSMASDLTHDDDGYVSLSGRDGNQLAQSPIFNISRSAPSSPSALYAVVSRPEQRGRCDTKGSIQGTDGYMQLNVGQVQQPDKFPYTKLTPSPAGSTKTLQDESSLNDDEHAYSETGPASASEDYYESLALGRRSIDADDKQPQDDNRTYMGLNVPPPLPKRVSPAASIESLRNNPSLRQNNIDSDGDLRHENRKTTYDKVDDPTMIFNELYHPSTQGAAAASFSESHGGNSFESYHEYDEPNDASVSASTAAAEDIAWTFSDLYNQAPKPVMIAGAMSGGMDIKHATESSPIGLAGPETDPIRGKLPDPSAPFYHCLNSEGRTDSPGCSTTAAESSQAAHSEGDARAAKGPYHHILEQTGGEAANTSEDQGVLSLREDERITSHKSQNSCPNTGNDIYSPTSTTDPHYFSLSPDSSSSA